MVIWLGTHDAYDLAFRIDSRLGGYTACGIPLIRSVNGNGNGIPLNGIPFNEIMFPFVSVRKIFESSVSVRFR